MVQIWKRISLTLLQLFDPQLDLAIENSRQFIYTNNRRREAPHRDT
jgi:hypothetical protein